MNRSCPNVSEIATLASIMNKHTGSTPLPSKAVMEMEKLEAETFALKMKQPNVHRGSSKCTMLSCNTVCKPSMNQSRQPSPSWRIDHTFHGRENCPTEA